LFDLRHYEDARTELEAACRLTPDYPEAVYLLALTEKQLGNRARSAELLGKAIALDPNNADAEYLLGQDLAQLGKREDGIAHWKRAVALNPEHGEALYNLFRALLKDSPQEAKTYQQRFATLQEKRHITDEAQTLGNFGVASAAARDWTRAVGQLKQALQVCGECGSRGDLHKNLGLIYCRSGDLENGKRELLLALQFKPNDADAKNSLKIIEELEHRPAGTAK
jgi:tetratricopeptide (TPR) repeat protein